MALTLALGVAIPGLAVGAAEVSPSVLPSPSEVSPAPEPGSTDSSESVAFYQTLSTLGAVGLGVVGLLWVRRHTTEL